MSTENKKIKVGITVGDINGIGIEVIIKAFKDNRMYQQITPVIYGSTKVANIHRKVLRMSDFRFNIIEKVEEAKSKKVNLINLGNDEALKVELGKPTKDSGEFALKSLEAATKDLAEGKIDILVTAPINKEAIQNAGFEFPGHTEYLAHLSKTEDYLMLLMNDVLKIGVVTGHIPLKEVAESLDKKEILNKIEILNKSLKSDFGIIKPKIAILGLNPHAGDNGKIGMEEKEIILPAILKAKENNILAFGPYSADGFFGSGSYKDFDAILAMYHDQGLAPFKALSFGSGVNFTAGLPIVRTSPDHGTAYEIAGQRKAESDSFRHAIFTAIDIYKKRNNYKAMTSNPLMAQKIEPRQK